MDDSYTDVKYSTVPMNLNKSSNWWIAILLLCTGHVEWGHVNSIEGWNLSSSLHTAPGQLLTSYTVDVHRHQGLLHIVYLYWKIAVYGNSELW